MRRQPGVLPLLLLFIVWTVVAMTPLMVGVDRAITNAVQRVASVTLDTGSSLLTVAGNIEVTAVLVLPIGIALMRTRRRLMAMTLWAGFLAGGAVEGIAKYWLPHPGVPEALSRPGLNVMHFAIQTPYAYPSGHAFRTLLLAAAVWMTWGAGAGHLRAPLRYGLITVTALMGVALVYLGAHWTSEVVGGYLLAVLCLVPVHAASAPVHSRGR